MTTGGYARMFTRIDGFGVSTDTVLRRLCTGPLNSTSIRRAARRRSRRSPGFLTAGVITPAHDVAFDPVLHTASDVSLAPAWLSGLRAQRPIQPARPAGVVELTVVSTHSPRVCRVRPD